MVPAGPSMSRSTAREARPSRTRRASATLVPHRFAAVRAVNGLIGSCATRPASRSLRRSSRIRYRRSDGGAPWGKRFSRSASCWYAPRAVAWAIAIPSLHYVPQELPAPG